MSSRNSFRRDFGWPLAIAVLIFAASSRSSVAGPAIVHIDKVAHFGVYALLATLLCRLGHGWRAGWWTVLVVSAYGASDEWHQLYVLGRSCDVFDWVADTSGAMVAVALYVGWGGYRRLLEMPLGTRQSREKTPADTPTHRA